MTPAELKAAADHARREGRLRDAEASLREAIAQLRDEGESLLLAHTIRHLGDLYRHMNDLGQATSCCAEALRLYRRFAGVAPPLDVANALRSMALVSEMQGNREHAYAQWREAGTLYARCGVESGVTEAAEKLNHLSE